MNKKPNGETKVCKGCGEEKSIDLFYKRKMSKDGIAYYCKVCQNRLQKASVAKNPRATLKAQIKALIKRLAELDGNESL